MMRRFAAVLVLALLIAVTALTQFSLAQATTSSQTEAASMTVYADGSVSLGINQTSTVSMPAGMNGTLGSTSMNFVASTSNGVTTLRTNETESLPSYMVSEAPYNYTGAVTAHGSFAGGVERGSVVVQEVPGVKSPMGSLRLAYQGNATVVTVSGNATVLYGTFPGSPGTPPVVINSSSLSSAISEAELHGLNATYLDQEFAMIPGASLSVTALSLNVQPGSDSAAILGSFQVKGNISGLEPALVSAYLCSTGVSSTTTVSTTTFYNVTTVTGFPTSIQSASPTSGLIAPSPGGQSCAGQVQGPSNAISSILEAYSQALKSYNYTETYSNGLLGVQETAVAAPNFNIDKIKQLIVDYSSSLGINGTESQLINSTRIDLSNVRGSARVYETASAEVTQVLVSNVVVYPPIVRNGTTFTMPAVFRAMGPVQMDVTLKGGTDAQGSVTIVLPAGVPAPANSTAGSATWTQVPFNALAPVQFVVTPAPATSSTAASTSSQSGFSSQDTILLVGAVVVVVAVVAATIALRRRPAAVP